MHKSIQLCDGISPEYVKEVELFLEEWESQSTTISVYSSGSTGTPKQFSINKSKVKESARATGSFFNFKKGQTLLLNLSPRYIAGKLMLVRALEFGMNILVAPVTNNPLLNINRAKIDFAAFVPYQVDAILRDPVSRANYEKISQVIIGGAPLPIQTEATLKKLRNESYVTFGMTETITHFALRKIGKSDTSYTCLPGFTINQDARGCLVINANRITDQLVTNDLITLIDQQTFQWLGRVDNVVNSAGIKLFPELLERKVEYLFPTNRYYFTGRKSTKFGEELILYIEAKSGYDLEKTKLKIQDILPPYERPKAIISVQKFNETPTGKIKRDHFISADECT